MALSWRPAVALAAALVATLVSGVSAADSGAPLEVNLLLSNILQELKDLFLGIPHAVKDFIYRLTHPIQTIGGLIDFFRPDHLIKLPYRHLHCSCNKNKTCMCCINATLPLFGKSEYLCQKLTFFPGNLSTAIDIISHNRSLIRTVLSGMHPPPICLPLPPQFPIAAICARLHDLGVEDDGFRICPTNEIQFFHWRLFVFNFECIRIGRTGIHFGYRRDSRKKPSSKG